jgi:hypothetical protein
MSGVTPKKLQSRKPQSRRRDPALKASSNGPGTG